MAYDYKKALEAGASEDQVLEYLTKTRKYDIQGAMTAGASKTQVIEYLANTSNTPAPVEVASEPEIKEAGGLFADALKTLVVKPAVRFGQAVGTPIARALGASEEDLARAAQTPVDVRIGAKRKITVEGQKSFGEGGGAQILGDVAKSASYLAPYGRIAKGSTAIANKVVGEGASRIIGGIAAGSTGGYATDVAQNLNEQQKITGEAFMPGFATILGGLTGGILEGGAVGVEKLSQGAKAYGRELEEQSFKLTPAQRSKLGSKLDELTAFSAEKIPAGNPEQRLAYADDLIENYEENLQFFLETVAKEKRASTSVPKDTFIRQLRAIKGAYKYDRDYAAIGKQIDDAIETINKQYPGSYIPVDKLNIFKRSTYKNAYNKAGNKVLDTVEHDIGDAARLAIERATKGGTIGDLNVGDFNREYGNLLQVKKLLQLAEGRPELGFTKRITSRVIGGLIGYGLGGIPGTIGGELLAEPIASKVAGTAAKTGLARRLMNVQPKKVDPVIQRLRP